MYQVARFKASIASIRRYVKFGVPQQFDDSQEEEAQDLSYQSSTVQFTSINSTEPLNGADSNQFATKIFLWYATDTGEGIGACHAGLQRADRARTE